MTPSRVSLMLLLAPLVLLALLGPSACAAQSRWKTGADAGAGACIYIYKCIDATGNYVPVYGGQAGNCAGRLGEHSAQFSSFDRLTRLVSLTSDQQVSGSMLDVLPVENNLEMLNHEACILKKCMNGAAARANAVAQNARQRLLIQQANAALPPQQQQPVPAALAFDPADTMRIQVFDPTPHVALPDVASQLNSAERWLVAQMSANPAQDRSICNRKMGGLMNVPAWVPAANPAWVDLVTTSAAVAAAPAMVGMRTLEWNAMRATQQQQALTNQAQTVQITQLNAQVQQMAQQIVMLQQQAQAPPPAQPGAQMMQFRARARAAASNRADALQPIFAQV